MPIKMTRTSEMYFVSSYLRFCFTFISVIFINFYQNFVGVCSQTDEHRT